MKKIHIVSLLACLVLTIAGCQQVTGGKSVQEDPAATNEQLEIVTTIAPLASMTKSIVGDLATVTNLVPPGTSVHSWEPLPADVAKVSKADLVIVNGLDLELFLEDLLAVSENPDQQVIVTSANIKAIEFAESHAHDAEHEEGEDEDHHDGEYEDEHEGEHEDEHHEEHEDYDDHKHGEFDPHVWLSLKNAEQQVIAITKALQAADPKHAEQYQIQSDAYKAELAIVDQEITEALVGQELQNFAVFHDAYGYFIQQYNLAEHFKGVVQEFPGREPSPAEFAELLAEIKEENIQVLFSEPQFSPKILEQIQSEIPAIVISELNPLGASADAEGYIQNMRAIKAAFTNLIIQDQ